MNDLDPSPSGVNDPTPAPASGRRAQAARNDQRILEAARAVYIADPKAPVSAVAKRAGVGISALYRRYSSKEELLRKLCADGLESYIAAAEAALADSGDPRSVLAEFMRRIVDADTHSLTTSVAGAFEPSEELYRRAQEGQRLTEELFDRIQSAGAIRPDASVDDLTFLFEQLAAVRVSDEDRTRELRRRYLALHLDALQTRSDAPLPGPAPSWDEVSERWQREP